LSTAVSGILLHLPAPLSLQPNLSTQPTIRKTAFGFIRLSPSSPRDYGAMGKEYGKEEKCLKSASITIITSKDAVLPQTNLLGF